jgi:hypothetical protein
VNKLLSPYHRYTNIGGLPVSWVRMSLCKRSGGFSVWPFNGARKWAHTLIGVEDFFNYKSDAMHHLDKKLVERGYTFLSQEQWDKYQVLI